MDVTPPTAPVAHQRGAVGGVVPATAAGRFGLAASLAIVAYVAAPARPAAELLPVAVTVAAAVAVLAGIALHDPVRRAGWQFVAAALGVHALAAAVHAVEIAGGTTGHGRAAAIELLAAPPMLVGLWGVAARRLPTGFGDRRWAVGTLTASALIWLTVVGPTLSSGELPFRTTDRVGVHALVDAIALAVVGRRLVGQRGRNWSLWLATAAFVAWGDAHAVVGRQIYDATFVTASPAAGALLIGPVLLGLAALVPDMARTEPALTDPAWAHRRSIRELLITSVIVVVVTALVVVAATGTGSVLLAALLLCIAIVAVATDAAPTVPSRPIEPIVGLQSDDVPRSPLPNHSSTAVPPTRTGPRPTSVSRAARREPRAGAVRRTALRSDRSVAPLEQLELVHLPYVDLSTGVVLGVEALVRWRHPTRGLLAPAEFFGPADRSDELRALDAWVATTAIRAAASWRSRPMIGINVGVARLGEPDWVDHVLTTASAAGLDPGRIVVETSERSFVDGGGPAAGARRLRDAGIHVAIDDFGRELGSLRTLTTAPIDIVKIRAGALGRSSSHLDLAAVRAVHTVGHRAAVVGIDAPDLLTQARRAGVQIGQGFALSRPLPGDVVARRFEPRPTAR